MALCNIVAGVQRETVQKKVKIKDKIDKLESKQSYSDKYRNTWGFVFYF